MGRSNCGNSRAWNGASSMCQTSWWQPCFSAGVNEHQLKLKCTVCNFPKNDGGWVNDMHLVVSDKAHMDPLHRHKSLKIVGKCPVVVPDKEINRVAVEFRIVCI